MTQETIFQFVECPYKLSDCKGLAVSASGMEIEQKDNSYIVRTQNGEEAFGNCEHYTKCYTELVKVTGPNRRPAEIK